MTKRTRQNNLASTTATTRLLPGYFKIYPEDIDKLSQNIKLAFRGLQHDAPYRQYFLYCKYGQQHQSQLTTTDLSTVVRREDKVGCVSAHVAVTFTHTDAGHFSVFWDSQATSQFLRGGGGGGRVVRYPLMGLHELANVQATSPTLTGFVDDVNVTFAQAYTPFVKAMDNNTTLYHDHPFLLTYLLRRTQKKFEHLVQCTTC